MRKMISNSIGKKYIRLSGILAAAVVVAAGLTITAPCLAKEDEMPQILVFDAVGKEGISKELAASATVAVKTYFRESHRVEALVINKESPSVMRAVLEKKLTLDNLASYSNQEQRVDVAKALGYPYAAGAEVSIEKDPKNLIIGTMPKPPKGLKVGEDERSKEKVNCLQVKVWLVQTDGKQTHWECARASNIVGESAQLMDNAMQSAASAAVLELVKQAFSKLKSQDEIAAPTEKSVAVESTQLPTTNAPNASDYSTQAEASLNAGNPALAIQQYQQAVSADPTNGSLRIKLAQAYAKKGLFAQAKSEIDRAEKIGIEKAMLDSARASIAAMESGSPVVTQPVTDPKADNQQTGATQENAQPATNSVPPAITPPSTATTSPIRRPKKPAALAEDKLREGDQLWNQGKPDEAAAAYAEAATINPADWRSYERLAAVDASMSLFGEAKKAIDKLKAAQPNPPAETVAKRYDMFRKSFDKAFSNLLIQLNDDTANYSRKIITRESYYSSVNGLGIRLESLTKFLDALDKPASKQPAALRRSIACGLLAQASATMLEYLETNDKKAKQNAELFIQQAKKEAEAAQALDANQNAPAPTQSAQPVDGSNTATAPQQ